MLMQSLEEGAFDHKNIRVQSPPLLALNSGAIFSFLALRHACSNKIHNMAPRGAGMGQHMVKGALVEPGVRCHETHALGGCTHDELMRHRQNHTEQILLASKITSSFLMFWII